MLLVAAAPERISHIPHCRIPLHSTTVNIFKGIPNNPLFCGILLTTSVLQVLIVEFGTYAFAVAEGGLPGKYWGLSIAFGAFELVVQQIINVCYRLAQRYNNYRLRKRSRRDGQWTTEPINSRRTGNKRTPSNRSVDSQKHDHSHQE